jgi:PPOX class probable FMN-dependent enzyme
MESDMAEADPHRITTVAQLRAIYPLPEERILKAKFSFLDDYAIAFIGKAPIIAIGSLDAGMDVSPRGGRAGFVHVIDRKTVAIADWPGNNKLETITNLLHDDRCAVLYMVPQQDVFLRTNGTATITRDPALLAAMAEGDKLPRLAIRIALSEVYFHCGKAIKRSRLWNPETWSPVESLTSIGKVLRDQVDMGDMTVEQINEHYRKAMKEGLY